MRNSCPYPNCNLELEHDGDHFCTRPPVPRGVIRQMTPPDIVSHSLTWRVLCELGNGKCRAEHAYVSEAGYIYELCDSHAAAVRGAA
jgi:hypothetical protein